MLPKLICVPPDRAVEAWPRVAHWIRAAMERLDLGSFGVVEADVLSGQSLLWLAWDGIAIVAGAVTAIHGSDKRKVLTIAAAGGVGMGDWLPLIKGLEDFGRSEGCAATRIVGPLAWARALEGYETRAVILERPN